MSVMVAPPAVPLNVEVALLLTAAALAPVVFAWVWLGGPARIWPR